MANASSPTEIPEPPKPPLRMSWPNIPTRFARGTARVGSAAGYNGPRAKEVFGRLTAGEHAATQDPMVLACLMFIWQEFGR